MTVREIRNGSHRNHKWEIRQRESDELTEKYGDVILTICDGSLGQYTERHDSAHATLTELESRAVSLINQLCEDDNVGKCTACGGFYNKRVNQLQYEHTLTWSDRHIFTHGMDPPYKQHSAHEETETCVWTTGRIFDALHVVTHLKETNLLFDEEELAECDSLVSCRGYNRAADDNKYHEIKS